MLAAQGFRLLESGKELKAIPVFFKPFQEFILESGKELKVEPLTGFGFLAIHVSGIRKGIERASYPIAITLPSAYALESGKELKDIDTEGGFKGMASNWNPERN